MFLLLVFIIFFLIQLYFYLYVFGKYAFGGQNLTFGKNTPAAATESLENNERPGVSIVVSVFNEEEHLSSLLTSLAEQVYPRYEIVLVDDGSSDGTYETLKKFQKDWDSRKLPVQLIRIDPSESQGKKKALALGIKSAHYPVILVTDADCVPGSNQWINQMTFGLQGQSEIVLGYGAYKKIKGSLINKLVRYETLLTALQYFSYALMGHPYMGVGRNLAYKKVLFDRVGFSSHTEVKSGDDDLFVSEVSTGKNTIICDHPDAFTVSEPKRDWRSWIRQKRRHVTTASHYKNEQKIRLGSFYLSQLGFYATALLLFFLKIEPLWVTALVLTRYLFFYLTLNRAATKLQEKDLVLWGPLYEISVIFMQLYVFVANMISPPKHW